MTVIKPKTGWFDIDIKGLFRYKDLIMLFVKRNFTSLYKQTILGPLWAIIQPFLTTVIFSVIFGNIAGLNDTGTPNLVFYMSANITWAYFSSCLVSTSNTFISNSAIMGKVYFPRLVMPISTVLTQLISFAIQFVFFMCFWVFYLVQGEFTPSWGYMALTPLIIIQMAMLGLGFGVIVSALTTKYRDLAMLVSFGVQLWMYATPVAYSSDIVIEKLGSTWGQVYMLNPMTPVIETMRYAYLGVGSFNLMYYLISWAITLVVLFFGIILFSRVEKTFMDTV
ncbi:MAG: ABC transporter permease [Clostridia bacterium]|nr:ABC transporter permease [Clostridia bacterium]